MAVDAMEIDSSPVVTPEVERKRKHKHKDASSPTKKRKQTDKADKKNKKEHSIKASAPATNEHPNSPFSLATATLYLPLSPISISPTHALASLLAEHLSPMLLTYYPPLKGVVMAYSNASISSHPPSKNPKSADQNPQPLTLAKSADEYGVLYVYLTATFLVFRPQRGQNLQGWVNVQSEGFLGAVVFNLFSVGIERKRLPKNWTWVPPGDDGPAVEESAGKDIATTDDESGNSLTPPGFNAEKEQFQPASLAADEIDLEGEEEEEASTGRFHSVSGHHVRGIVHFRVVDVDVIPGSERDRGFLSIEGTMLSLEDEEKLVQAETKGHSLPPSFLSSAKQTTRIIPVTSEPPASAVTEVSMIDIEAGSESEPEPEKEKKAKTKSKSKKKDKSKEK
ncbi:hypothetical protein N7495_007261 [Penicillium taxi]|uniref:uncharacterized protein n=1 Tax=Penicillium taxi TaxID=168475 RepID=UPI0025458DDD|nr:uncharacterized protein N7495_007261 [Penicillium taxi]KAJ5895570.1 hypothetical protein N7495_007261 [Penicillium taxi]